MTNILKVGAPSLREKGAENPKDTIKALKYPVSVKVKNLMPRDVSFPEVRGLFLKHVANREGRAEKQVLINGFSEFARLISSVEQVAELNNYSVALAIELPEILTKATDKVPAGKAEETETEAVKETVVETEAEVKAKTETEVKTKATARKKRTTSKDSEE